MKIVFYRKYVPVKYKFIKYVNVRYMSYKQDKCRTSWGLIKNKIVINGLKIWGLLNSKDPEVRSIPH